MTELPGADAALAATPGATLAAARQAHGLSVTDVAEQMRISPRQVAAIESGRYGELPGAVFVRGFVRNYARLLKLDPVPLLHALEPELSGEVPLRAHEIAGTLPVTTRRHHRPSWWLGAAAAVIAIAAALAAYEWWRAQYGAVPSVQRDTLLDTPAAPPAAAPPAPASSAQAPIPLTPETLADSPAGGGGSAAAQAPATPPAAETAAAAREPVPAPAPGEGRLEIRFLQESWIELRDGAGNVQFSDTGAAGSTRSFDVRPPVRMVVGNASGVRITYNGQPFDVDAHAARNIARFTLE
jgi:cytoskeleton protein RodZ